MASISPILKNTNPILSTYIKLKPKIPKIESIQSNNNLLFLSMINSNKLYNS